ncbi:hypothetical protein RRF57_010912 [Xylaria bambusicola]|uniref:FAD-binding domain-containing protein n=1 Tax=Xylaria bambusicola TaxID=326684 RepID=A0AAN7ULY0_9PEZI
MMRIAIIGGGLAGVSLANLLMKNPNLEIGSKRLDRTGTDIARGDVMVLSHFQTALLVIGVDGINSHSSPAGFWDCWGIFPSEKVRGSVNEEYLRCEQQHAFTADRALHLYALEAGGTMIQAIILSG